MKRAAIEEILREESTGIPAVPCAFQNTEAALEPDGEDCWRWQAEGDNHGMTRKLADGWYYFEAAF